MASMQYQSFRQKQHKDYNPWKESLWDVVPSCSSASGTSSTTSLTFFLVHSHGKDDILELAIQYIRNDLEGLIKKKKH